MYFHSNNAEITKLQEVIEREVNHLKNTDARIIDELTNKLVSAFTDIINKKMRMMFNDLSSRITNLELTVKEMGIVDLS